MSKSSDTSGPEFPVTDVLVTTRQSLHGLAEWLLAGPQYARAGTIRLRVVDGGVETKDGQVGLDAASLVVRSSDGEVRYPLKGTLQEVGAAAGIEPSVPGDLYSDHAPVGPDNEIDLDQSTAQLLFEWFERGRQGLVAFAPDAEPILWPEHFDLGISSDEVNYGISLGDATHAEPYAYIGPFAQRDGDFWNAPFGAVRSANDLPTAGAIGMFFAEGAKRAASDPLAQA